MYVSIKQAWETTKELRGTPQEKALANYCHNTAKKTAKLYPYSHIHFETIFMNTLTLL